MKTRGKRTPGAVLHQDMHISGTFVDLVGLDDVRMIEQFEDTDLVAQLVAKFFLRCSSR